MNEKLSPELRALLEAERRAPEPPAETRERVRARVEATLGLAAAAGAATTAALTAKSAAATAAASSAPTATGIGTVVGVKLVVAKAVVVAVGAVTLAGGTYVATRPPKPAPVQTRASTPQPPMPPPKRTALEVAPPTVIQAPAEIVAVVEPPARPVARPRPPARERTLLAEEALLESARAALQRGDFARALDEIERHARRFSNGQLAEARESLAVKALVAADRRDEARARADGFVARFPHSLFRPAVEASLEPAP